MILTLQLLCLLLGFTVECSKPLLSQTDTEELIELGENIYLPKNYSYMVAPKNESSTDPIEVTLRINHLDILEIDDIKYTIKLQMYLGIEWEEPRILRIESREEKQDVSLDIKQLDKLWIPDLDIYNLSKIENFKVVRNLAGLWVKNGKRLFYSQTMIVTILCKMNFKDFPLDSQFCTFSVGSYHYDINSMIFISSDDDLELERKVLLDYDIEIKRLSKENRIYFWEGTGTNYSLDGFEMVFTRHKLQYIIQYYITSGLLVVVSWVSFLIDPNVVPGRMTLLVTLFLVLTNIFNNIPGNSPKVVGFNALSAWVLSCILFLFGALIGYAGILFRKMFLVKILPHESEDDSQSRSKFFSTNRERSIDAKFIVLFPLLFLFFNFCYWIAFL